MTHTVGIVGLGEMGMPISRNFLAEGYETIVHDVRQDPMETLASEGATAVDSLREVARRSDVVIVLVQDEAQTRAVVAGDDGLLAGADGDLVTIVSSTVHPELVPELAEAVGDRMELIDAPVCRGDDAAKDGNLLVLAGGDEAVFESIESVFRPLAEPEDVHYMGNLGLGQVAKSANNVLLWTGLVANVEVFDLCESYGMDIDTLTDALAHSSGMNWGIRHWNDRYPRHLTWAHKDMRIVMEMASEQDVIMPFAGHLRQEVRELREKWKRYEE